MARPNTSTPGFDIGVAVANSLFFIKLPPELRSVIYRMVLVQDYEDDPIQVGNIPSSLEFEPGLLLACCMARKEASCIFHLENRFRLSVWDYSVATSRYFTNKLRQLPAKLDIEQVIDVDTAVCGVHDWHNFLGWLSCIHDGSVMRLGLHSTEEYIRDFEADVVSAMFDMAVAMRGVHWSVVETVLETQYRHLLHFSDEWRKCEWDFEEVPDVEDEVSSEEEMGWKEDSIDGDDLIDAEEVEVLGTPKKNERLWRVEHGVWERI